MGGLALALAVLAISWGSILARLCVSPAPVVAFYRLLFASLLILPPGARRLKGAAAPGRAWAAAGIAGSFLALHFATWIASLQHTSIAASTLLVSTQPVVSVLLSSVILRETPPRRTWMGIALALAGTAAIAGGDLTAGGSRFLGDLLALTGAVFAAAYLVVARAARHTVPLPAWLLLVNGCAAVVAAGGVLIAGAGFVPAARRDWVWFLLMATVPHLLGHGALNWAVRRLRAYVANLAVLGEPVLASLYAFWIFAEAPPPNVWAGAALIAAGVAVVLRDEARRVPDAIIAPDPGASR